MHQFEYSDKVNAMRPSIIRELLKQMADPSLISFAGGNPSTEAFPMSEIKRISDELLSGPPAAVLQYSITEGYPPLREKAARYLNQSGAVVKDTDDVIVLSGSQQAMDYLGKLLCNDGDVVATEDPAFLGALNSFRSNGAVLAGVPLQPDGVDLAALEKVLGADKKPKFYYTIPNFQNPTGFTTSWEKRRAVYDLCKRYGVPILEDNPYGELRFTGKDIPPIKSLDDAGLVVYAASMSKVFAPGMRVAFCAGPKELLGRMTVAKQGNDVHTNLWGQRVIDKFMEECDLAAHIARLREIYGQKARHMMDAVGAAVQGKASFVPVEGGMFLWLTLNDGIDVPDFVARCLAQKLAVVPGSAFFVDDAAPCQSVRLNFSTPTDAQIDAGAAITRDVLADMQA